MAPIESRPASGFAERYWAIWLVAVLVSFLGYEIFALVTGHAEDTLSNWVWSHLRIHVGESITQWSAGDLLTFAVYVSVFILWLPWHFWLGKFRLCTSGRFVYRRSRTGIIPLLRPSSAGPVAAWPGIRAPSESARSQSPTGSPCPAAASVALLWRPGEAKPSETS